MTANSCSSTSTYIGAVVVLELDGELEVEVDAHEEVLLVADDVLKHRRAHPCSSKVTTTEENSGGWKQSMV